MNVYCPYCGSKSTDHSEGADKRSERQITCINRHCGITSCIRITDDPSIPVDNWHDYTKNVTKPK